MNRGTTQDYEINLPNVDFTNIAELWIDFAQWGQVKIHKTLSDVTIDGQTVTVHLSQTDTLSLRGHSKVQIQCRLLTNDGDASVTETVCVSVGEILKDGEIGAVSGDSE